MGQRKIQVEELFRENMYRKSFLFLTEPILSLSKKVIQIYFKDYLDNDPSI